MSTGQPDHPARYPSLGWMSAGALAAGLVLGLLQPLFAVAVGGFGIAAGPSLLGLLFLACLAAILLFGVAALAVPGERGTTVPIVGLSVFLAIGMVGGNWVASVLHISFAAPRPQATPVGPGWSATGSLLAGRASHTATLLRDGRVLVAGGLGGPRDRALSSAELYDPSTGEWTATGAMVRARSDHQAVLLSDGRVLVIGVDGRDAELYDPTTASWSVTGNPKTPRFEYTATLLANGRVIVVGGVGGAGGEGYLTSAEIYEPGSGEWRDAAPLGTARSQHSATLLADGRVLVAGGRTSFDPARASAELYDPSSAAWSVTGPMRTARASHGAVLLSDGTVLVVGGSIVAQAANELFDPRSGEWRTGERAWGGLGPTVLLVDDGRVLVMDGLSGTIEVYDPRSPAAAGATPSAAQTNHGVGASVTLLPDGRVLIAGGHRFFSVGGLATAHIYDPR